MRACFAAIYVPPFAGRPAASPRALIEIAQAFSPRYEPHRDELVSIDLAGLERLMRPRAGWSGSREAVVQGGAPAVWPVMGEELMQAVTARGLRGHIAMASSRVAAIVLARARPGLTVVPTGHEAAWLAPVLIDVLMQVTDSVMPSRPPAAARGKGAAKKLPARERDREDESLAVTIVKQWGLRTLGELAALPAAELTSRLGAQALQWQAMARGEDLRPLVPAEPEERFDASLELEWPIEGLEPLSFVLTRLLEPLSTRLERRDRGAAMVHVTLDLVTGDRHARHLQLPSPIRDVRTLRTLALLDIESHPPAAAIDRVEVVIDPTPGRVLQHTLFARALPTPERLSTLLARLVAVVGEDRVGAPATVDTHRPGAFDLRPFATEHKAGPLSGALAPGHRPSATGIRLSADLECGDERHEVPGRSLARDAARGRETEPQPSCRIVLALRRCRQPVPARVVVEAGRPVRITSDRRGFGGGTVTSSTGPWRTSGDWWKQPDEPGRARAVSQSAWDRDEWEVALTDGAVYRVFQDRSTQGWFIDGIFD